MITGSSRGIGQGLALTFAKNGYNVIIHGRNQGQLARVKGDIEKNNVTCHVVVGDVNTELFRIEGADNSGMNGTDLLIHVKGIRKPR